MFNPGDRVVVRIPDASKWNKLVSDAVEGKTGVVQDEKYLTSWGATCVLVNFDEPVVTGQTTRLPITGHWFERNEVQPVGC